MKRVRGDVRGFVSEFWKFAAKGNMFDLAVGVVLGTAFGAIVTSLVKDIITPLISIITGSTNFSTWTFTLREATIIGGEEVPALVISCFAPEIAYLHVQGDGLITRPGFTATASIVCPERTLMRAIPWMILC